MWKTIINLIDVACNSNCVQNWCYISYSTKNIFRSPTFYSMRTFFKPTVYINNLAVRVDDPTN